MSVTILTLSLVFGHRTHIRRDQNRQHPRGSPKYASADEKRFHKRTYLQTTNFQDVRARSFTPARVAVLSRFFFSTQATFPVSNTDQYTTSEYSFRLWQFHSFSTRELSPGKGTCETTCEKEACAAYGKPKHPKPTSIFTIKYSPKVSSAERFQHPSTAVYQPSSCRLHINSHAQEISSTQKLEASSTSI